MKRLPIPPYLLPLGRRRLAVGILALLIVLSVDPLLAAQSNPTGGRIHGRAPVATGNLTIRLPDGTTALTNNAQVESLTKPNDFTLAPLIPGLVYTDSDGDLPFGDGITLANPPGVTWIWKKGATPLTSTQLSQPFQNNFANRTVLTVSASALVNVMSVSGLPNVGTQTFTTPIYNVVVKDPPPRVYVNDTTFAIDAGFPTTGFVGANFKFYMNGTNTLSNGNYTYSSNQSWVTVSNGTTSSAGTVTFSGAPSSATKSVIITITDRSGIDAPRVYSYTINRWFVPGSGLKTPSQTDTYCAGGGYATPTYASMTNSTILNTGGTRAAVQGLWPEWGNMRAYGGGWVYGIAWAKESSSGKRYNVELISGRLKLESNDLNSYYACYKLL